MELIQGLYLIPSKSTAKHPQCEILGLKQQTQGVS